MPRYKRTERDEALGETRRRLLDAASDEFARAGYDGAKVDRISAAAGFAKGTIYNHFQSKRALMLALIHEIAAAHHEFIAGQVHDEDDARQRIERFFQAGFAFVTTNLAQARVMVNNIYGSDAEFKQVMYEAYQPLFEMVGKDIIALGIAQGSFRSLDPTSTAGLVMTIYLGTASQVSDEGKTWLDADEVADFVLSALRA